MPDILTRAKRSAVMSLIRGAGNKGTELRLIQVFRANGITGWRRGCSLALAPRSAKGQVASAKTLARNSSGLLRHLRGKRSVRFPVSGFRGGRSSGRVKADFIFPKLRVALFVDGCFWHGCPKHATQPKTNAKFWRDKIATNKARDRRVNSALRKRGWTVLRIWEHELTGRNRPRLLRRLLPLLLPPGHL